MKDDLLVSMLCGSSGYGNAIIELRCCVMPMNAVSVFVVYIFAKLANLYMNYMPPSLELNYDEILFKPGG